VKWANNFNWNTFSMKYIWDIWDLMVWYLIFDF
jgi:hypothetical protein